MRRTQSGSKSVSEADTSAFQIFEIPANLLIRKIGPRNQLATVTVGWGAVMLGMGWLTSWEQLAVCRVLLGLLESAFFPGCA